MSSKKVFLNNRVLYSVYLWLRLAHIFSPILVSKTVILSVFQERKMPSGEEEVRGLSITFTSTSRHHSGIYTCSADNGFGRAINATITLDVQRKVSVSLYSIRSDFKQQKCHISLKIRNWRLKCQNLLFRVHTGAKIHFCPLKENSKV